MFCLNCGKSDQTPNTYCRSCGEFLSDANKLSAFSFGGISPQQNVNTINILSFIASIISLVVGIWMYATQFNVPVVLYLAAAVLLCNAAWHFSNFIIGMKLKKRLNRGKEKLSENIENLQSAETRDLLPQANAEQFIEPTSITEDATLPLKEKINRTSS